MTFHLDISDHHYQETFAIGHGWNNPTTITRRASVVEEKLGFIGIMELTDLFFQTVQEYTVPSITHSNNLVISNSPTFVLVKIQNLKDKMGWKETQNDRRLKITLNPELDQKEIHCSEAVLVEKMGISNSDTIHEWTLTLSGMDQTQSFTFRTKVQEP